MDEELKSGVYWIRNKINNKRYAGSSGNLKNRWRQHRSLLRRGCHDNSHLQSAWNIYGEENFEFAVIAYMDAEKALEFEDYLLKNYPTMFEYNIARDATAPMLGRDHTDEAKQKIGEANSGENNYLFGKHLAEETKEKIGKSLSGENHPNFGKHLSEEHKRKISQANIGKTHSEEIRAKIGDAERGDKNHKYIDIPNEKIMEMKSLRAQGYPYQKIADAFGVSRATVRRRLNNISEQC